MRIVPSANTNVRERICPRTHDRVQSPEAVPLARSGEVFELEEQIRRTVEAFRERRALVPGAEARKRIVVCLEAERSVREGREVDLSF